jgi:plastocyanin
MTDRSLSIYSVSMGGSRAYVLAAVGLMMASLLLFGVFATYAMVGRPGGMWNMQDMHQNMMGGGADTSGAQVTQGAAQQPVQIRDFAFTPGNLRVPVGATITWTNYDGAPHSATADDGTWDTGILNKDQNASVTFNTPADYSYYCTLHPDMKARLQVR